MRRTTFSQSWERTASLGAVDIWTRRTRTSLCRNGTLFLITIAFSSFFGLATKTLPAKHRSELVLEKRLRSIFDYQPLIFIRSQRVR